MKSVFSIDIEDWFHILDVSGAPATSEWDKLPSGIEDSLRKLFEMLALKNVRATCFFLGWVAEKYPRLVTEAVTRGHEIASHGYIHQPVYEMEPDSFLQDVIRAKKLLEDISGVSLLGYRAPGFSVTDKTPWFWQKLAEAGYRYSSSVFPAGRSHGGLKTTRLEPHIIETESGTITEFPISVSTILGRNICFFGGGYLRFFPYWLVNKKANRVLKQRRPVTWYIHPREIDSHHHRIPMNFIRRFKSYYNLKSTEIKLNKILDDFECLTFSDYITQNSING